MLTAIRRLLTSWWLPEHRVARRPDLPGMQITMKVGGPPYTVSWVPTGTTAEGCERFIEDWSTGELKVIDVDSSDGSIVHVDASQIVIVNRINADKLREVEERTQAQSRIVRPSGGPVTAFGAS